MAKRVYTPKAVSPEIARENAIGAAKSHILYAQRDVNDAEMLIARIAKHGPVAADGVGAEISMARAERSLEQRKADLARCEAELASLLSDPAA